MENKARKRLGNFGERLAVERLTGLGYRVIETNWRCEIGEVDIVAWHGQCLTFVEVRTRRGNAAGSPEESVTQTKRQRLQSLVAAYLEAHPTLIEAGEWPECRVDLAAVEFDLGGGLRRFQVHQNIVEGD